MLRDALLQNRLFRKFSRGGYNNGFRAAMHSATMLYPSFAITRSQLGQSVGEVHAFGDRNELELG